MFTGHYDDWINSRMNGIDKYIIPGYFNSKTLLELGCGHAHLGDRFSKLGAIVTSSDARQEHIETASQLYPHLKTVQIDCDKDAIHTFYDVILHWGLLYHLAEIDAHLKNVSEKCNVLLLETEVSDTDDKTFVIPTEEGGYDQAFNGKGIRPSQQYVEELLQTYGFEFVCIKDPILNAYCHQYDWNIQNTKTWSSGFRRFWICWKNVESPIVSFSGN